MATIPKFKGIVQHFSVWWQLKDHSYLNKLAAFSCKFV